ncbi:SDR family oxidoreductase [Dictyobacter formicarum]|uniref:Dioxygenase n=1 Tax=Dictyobacter formicarum TaxID=2778368 RepID=A0ABQ3VJG1_9CHLR|nr:SDR family oxidoreductase [Dictyobacter formicarum]GHO85261.1 dioxygenase [Dictyobacter formicarum]
MPDYKTLFSIEGQTVVITGGGGVLGRVMAQALAEAGARVAVISLHEASAAKVVETIHQAGGEAIGLGCDVMDKTALEDAQREILSKFSSIDILINGAGGNQPGATTSPERSFFDLDTKAVSSVFDLNFSGTFQTCQIFGRNMVEQGHGCIVNIASMNALRPLTKIPAYSAAKSAIANFTQWLSVHMAQEYSDRIRVNAIAPGFFLTEQNRFLLTDKDTGAMTKRGQAILDHTPMGRFGVPEDLIGALLWLTSPASAFVTGTVIPVDGGFSAFSGV